MHVVIFAGGSVQDGQAIQAALNEMDLLIAADSGAATALAYGHVPAYIVGDFDSLEAGVRAELERQGSRVIAAAVEKDETDTELAVQMALEQGATRITLLGALGGERFDHTMANVLLLAAFATVPMRIVDGAMTCWLLHGPGRTVIEGKKGDLLSLLPLTGDATGMRTNGLYYPLRGETLHFGKPRGMSNVFTGIRAELEIKEGMVFIIHTLS